MTTLIETPPSGVLVGVVAQETARFSMFAASMTDLEAPDGSSVKWRFGHNIAQSTNALIDEMYARNHEAVWIMGDDHSFSPGILAKLLDRNVDIVVPLCLMRNPPYRPVAFMPTDDPDKSERLELTDFPDGGLIEVKSVGSAGMLIKRSALDRIERPWFGAMGGPTNRVGEDIGFCMRAADAGVAIHVDLDTVLGHCLTSVVWPVREDDGWTFGFSMMGGFKLTMPPGIQQYADDCS